MDISPVQILSQSLKKKHTIAADGFDGYWHPADGHVGKAIIVFPGSGADYELTKKGSKFLRNAGWIENAVTLWERNMEQ